jgi:hypothetical protein
MVRVDERGERIGQKSFHGQRGRCQAKIVIGSPHPWSRRRPNYSNHASDDPSDVVMLCHVMSVMPCGCHGTS